MYTDQGTSHQNPFCSCDSIQDLIFSLNDPNTIEISILPELLTPANISQPFTIVDVMYCMLNCNNAELINRFLNASHINLWSTCL